MSSTPRAARAEWKLGWLDLGDTVRALHLDNFHLHYSSSGADLPQLLARRSSSNEDDDATTSGKQGPRAWVLAHTQKSDPGSKIPSPAQGLARPVHLRGESDQRASSDGARTESHKTHLGYSEHSRTLWRFKSHARRRWRPTVGKSIIVGSERRTEKSALQLTSTPSP